MTAIQGDRLIIRCREIHDIARQAHELLEDTLRRVGAGQNIYTFKSRIKSAKSIWHKVHRNRGLAGQLRSRLADPEGKEETPRASLEQQLDEAERFSPEDVLDAWGCRYVTLFEDQKPALIRDLFQKLETFNAPAAVPVPVVLIKCSIYYTPQARGSKDRAHQIKELLLDSAFAQKVILDRAVVKDPIERTGYSSAHFNFEVPVIVDFPRGDRPTTMSQSYDEKARFEVQVRDVFEEAWSEAEHYLFYSRKDEFGSPSKAELQAMDSAKELVDVNRGAIDVARTWITTIKQQLERARDKNLGSVDTRSTTARGDDRAEIKTVLSAHVPSSVLGLVDEAYNKLGAAEKAETKEDLRRLYAESAAKFEALRGALRDVLELRVPRRANMPIRYFINAELANSLVFGEHPDGLIPATELYAALIADYPNDPSLRLRYARALMRRGDLESAVPLLKDVPKLVQNDPLTGPKHWLPIAAGTLLGYIHDKWADIRKKAGNSDGCIEERITATNVTMEAVKFWRQLPAEQRNEETYRVLAYKATSNVIFYLSHLVKAGKTEKGLDATALRRTIEEHDSIQVPRFRDHYNTLDNKMHGYVALGEAEKAKKLAREIYKVLQGHAQTRAGRALEFHEIGVILDEDERENFKTATNVLFSDGREWD